MEARRNDHDSHFIYFNQLDGEIIKKMALRLEGAVGPSGIELAVHAMHQIFHLGDTKILKIYSRNRLCSLNK